jgi:hypothetical protein
MRSAFTLSLLVGLTVLPGCAGGGGMGGLGGLGDILGSVMGGATGQPQQGQAQTQQVQAEVQQLDTQRQRLAIRTAQGQSGSVLYDQRTVVVYRQQQYPVTALERGDIINMQLVQAGQNDVYVARVDVVQSVQERQGMR